MAVEPVALAQLAQKYRAEFETQFEGLRARTTRVADEAKSKMDEAQTIVAEKKQEIVPALQDMSPVEGLVGERVLETYTWAAVMLFTYSMGTVLTSYLLSPLLSLLGLGTISSLLLGYVLLPYVAYRHTQQPSADDETTRFKLLAFSVVEGLLIGYALADRTLATVGPLIWLTPLVIAFATQLSKGAFLSRAQLLGATCGAALAAHILLGLVMGQLGFAYAMLSAAYAGAGFASFQLYIKYAKGEQNLTVFMLSLAAQAVVYFVFGSSYESLKQPLSMHIPNMPNPLNAMHSK